MPKMSVLRRLQFGASSLLIALLLSAVMAPFASAAPVDLDLVEGDELVVSVDPASAKVGTDFKVVIERRDGGVFNLPSVAWPDIVLADIADAANLSEETKAKLQSFAAKFRSEIVDGDDLVRLSVIDKDDITVISVPFLVSTYPYLEQSADHKKLSVTMPITEESISLVAGDYFATAALFNSAGDDLFGDELFKVTKLFDFNFDFNWGGFMLPGDAAVPTDIKVSSNTVKPGATMSVTVYDQGGNGINLDDNSDWDLQIQSSNPAAVLKIGSYKDGDLTKDGAGVYSFKASDKEGAYRVVLLNDSGVKVDSVDFKVKAGFVLDLGAAGVLDPFIDLNDLLGDLAGFDLVGDEANGGDQPAVEEQYPCSDVDNAFWGRDILQKLIEKDLYPVIRSLVAVDVTCRPVQPVLRKEFTAWLLNAYRPDVVVGIDELDLSDMPFPDVDKDDPYAPYIFKAYALGIISGNPDGTFKPDAQINRAEVLKILLRSSNLFNATDDEVADLESNHADDMPSKRFKDAKNENAWYYPYLYFGAVKSIIQGYADGNAKMEQGVIYGEAAKILYLSLKLEGKID